MLRNFYRKGYNSWQKGVKGKPYAFVIPEDQGDPRRLARMVELLRAHGIEVSRLTAPVKVKEGTFPKGDLRRAAGPALPQLRGRPARAAEVPARRPTSPTTTWRGRCPSHYGLEAKRIDDAKIVSAPRRRRSPRAPVVERPGRRDAGRSSCSRTRGRRRCWRRASAWRRSRCRSPRRPSRRAARTIPPAPGSSRRRRASRAALDDGRERARARRSRARRRRPTVAAHGAPIPRLAVWHLWADTESAGWLRLALDQEKIPYAYIRDEEIRAGQLRENYDVILYGDNDES